MSLLTELVSAISEDERKELAAIPVRGKQATILHAILDHPGSEEPMRAAAVNLNMTASHLYAVQSKLLERCYETLAPGGGFDLLGMLVARGLDVHYRKALHTLEQAIQREDVSEYERHDFYTRLLHLMISTSSALFSRRAYKAALVLWERTLVSKGPAEELLIEVYELVGSLYAFILDPERKRSPEGDMHWLKQIDCLRERVEAGTSIEALYYLYYAYSMFYVSIVSDPEQLEYYNLKLLELVDKLPSSLSHGERKKLELRGAAVAFVKGDYRTAYERYREQWKLHGIRLFSLYSFHLSRFLRVSIEIREFAMAEEILETGFPAYRHVAPSPIAAAGSMYETLMHLLRHDIEHARRSLRRAQRQNAGAAYGLSVDLFLRFMEVILELFDDNEDEYVEKLVERAIKHMSRRGMNLKTGEDEVYGFYALKDVISGNPDSELVRDFLAHRLHTHPSLGVLLREAIEKKARRSRRASSKH